MPEKKRTFSFNIARAHGARLINAAKYLKISTHQFVIGAVWTRVEQTEEKRLRDERIHEERRRRRFIPQKDWFIPSQAHLPGNEPIVSKVSTPSALDAQVEMLATYIKASTNHTEADERLRQAVQILTEAAESDADAERALAKLEKHARAEV